MNLDDALHAWAVQEVALPEPVADDIFREVVATSPGLGTRWWTNFSGQLAVNVVAGTWTRRPVVTAVGR